MRSTKPWPCPWTGNQCSVDREDGGEDGSRDERRDGDADRGDEVHETGDRPWAQRHDPAEADTEEHDQQRRIADEQHRRREGSDDPLGDRLSVGERRAEVALQDTTEPVHVTLEERVVEVVLRIDRRAHGRRDRCSRTEPRRRFQARRTWPRR